MSDSNDHDDLIELVRDVAAYAGYMRTLGVRDVGGATGVQAEAVSGMRTDGARPALPLFGAPEPHASGARETLEAIREDLGDCVRCKLHEFRTHIVYGEGNPAAELMFVGEGPGADEDAQGRPFVGAAGQLLDKIIQAIGMRREQVYIANVIKCRPPDNRTPEPDEAQTCQQFLFRQIAVVSPKIIVCLGNTPTVSLLGLKGGITRNRGAWYDYHGIKVMPTFHPAYLLREPSKKREVWEDMKMVRAELST